MTTSEAMVGELGSSERVLWSGQPRQGLVLRGSDVFFIPFSVLWCVGIAFSAVISTLFQSDDSFIGGLSDLLFVLAGIYFLVGRFFVEAWQRARTHYAVTSERVLIVSGLLSRSVLSLNIKTLADISFSQRSGGRGTISFGGPVASMCGGMAGWPGADHFQGPRFELVENPKAVYDLIRDAQRTSK